MTLRDRDPAMLLAALAALAFRCDTSVCCLRHPRVDGCGGYEVNPLVRTQQQEGLRSTPKGSSTSRSWWPWPASTQSFPTSDRLRREPSPHRLHPDHSFDGYRLSRLRRTLPHKTNMREYFQGH